MPRWPEHTRTRLVDAAFGLFVEQGYSGTTVEQIATRAGATSRTFFRHFRDKDEVLFADDDELLPELVSSIGRPRDAADAGAMMRAALGELADRFEPDRPRLQLRQRIIEQDVGLAGRELAKQARWQRVAADALRERGFEREDAEILAAIGFALFTGALHEWLEVDDGTSLRAHVERRFPRVAGAMSRPVPG
ncbi:TetR/AcrR family transcriptional regulator [Agromyces aurantiacus]|uniref:TetR/AcrR family transcriptional regulator n=1 Tax=Agromyces aurantiacus TaxID=165814 RepID=A0ABV9R500_9MICO|nr:TetR/AcrR family transcriptional regulator [Agromyces aurantiacus]MBM7503580.1 AcrR family transcriptional regulator [Agromyces aurantiacus]